MRCHHCNKNIKQTNAQWLNSFCRHRFVAKLFLRFHLPNVKAKRLITTMLQQSNTSAGFRYDIHINNSWYLQRQAHKRNNYYIPTLIKPLNHQSSQQQLTCRKSCGFEIANVFVFTGVWPRNVCMMVLCFFIVPYPVISSMLSPIDKKNVLSNQIPFHVDRIEWNVC